MRLNAGRLSAATSVMLSLALFSGCRHHAAMREQYLQMRPAMMAGDWETAGKQLETAKDKDKIYKEDDRVMYWLNMGTVQHYANNAAGSNENLIKAESAMQELWTKSITSEASKVIVSETVQAYEGEDFEKVLVYLYTALNNVNLGRVQDAIVEARRADELLKKMLVHYEKEGQVGTLYKQDAFMLWLVGLFYEIEGPASWNDALLAYKAAHKSYLEDYAGTYGTSMPKYVAEDIARLGRLLKDDGARELAHKAGASGDTADKLGQGMAEVIVIHGSGESPFKQELFIDGTMPDNYVMRIALPQFVANPSQVAYAQLRTDGVEARTETAEPLTQMVLKNFEHRLPAIKTRAIARAVIKYAATKAAQAVGEKAGGGLVGALLGVAGNVASAVSEAADLRSWTTLPGAYGVARAWVPAGPHKLEVSFHTSSGAAVGKLQQITLDLKPGERKIVSVRSLQ